MIVIGTMRTIVGRYMMNERIKKLAIESGAWDRYNFEHKGDDVAEYQKFAELIVRECMNQCVDIQSARAISEHFGVE